MDEQLTMAEQYLDKIVNFGFEYGPQLIGGILVLLFGLWITKFITQGVGKALTKGNVDPSLIPFLKRLTSIILKILVIITVMSMIGIQMTSFIAILGAAGLAVGLALSGTLQNFAGGVMILLFKPFKVGDYIEAQGHAGSVKEIQIFNTILKTPDAKIIIIPNGGLANSSMINYSAEERRRVDWTFGIGYGDNVETARKVLKDLMDADDRVLKDPEVFIAVSELGDNSVNFAVRAWVQASDYWPLYFAMNERVYNAFNKEGLNIPFPQMDVHLHQ